ncbi:MAG: malectin domain-containing carbohydrate-binding protein, partial [Acidimicrobiia bacterium]|nr:malectin domain-containing carbohydrate-binding protein [Acidimicrobiia bacterium]
NQPGASGAIDMTHPSVTSQADVPPMEVFQTEVYGPQTFDFLVVDGTYEVRLLFAETYGPASVDDGRLFDVEIEGVQVLDDFDVWETAGNIDHKAVIETFLVEVNDGNGLTIETLNNVENASVRGIMIRKVVYAANAGAGAVGIWDAGSGFVSGGSSFNTGDTITLDPSAPRNTPQSVFQNELYGDTTWTFSVDNGDYEVQLFLAETFATTVGARVFDVSIEGNPVLSGFDMVAAGYLHDVGFVQRFDSTVSDGDVVIDFVTVTDNASVKGIVIIEKALAAP